ncbi:hypothetical protein HDU79_006874 [Rhizoclosmatium sp. JEL0117]|nr:hypothetical protein HDU79_006874 [Rhizoclosmatium sp. JEL0117]
MTSSEACYRAYIHMDTAGPIKFSSTVANNTASSATCNAFCSKADSSLAIASSSLMKVDTALECFCLATMGDPIGQAECVPCGKGDSSMCGLMEGSFIKSFALVPVKASLSSKPNSGVAVGAGSGSVVGAGAGAGAGAGSSSASSNGGSVNLGPSTTTTNNNNTINTPIDLNSTGPTNQIAPSIATVTLAASAAGAKVLATANVNTALGNGVLPQNSTNTAAASDNNTSQSPSTLVIALSSVFSILAVLLLVCLCCYYRRRRADKSQWAQVIEDDEHGVSAAGTKQEDEDVGANLVQEESLLAGSPGQQGPYSDNTTAVKSTVKRWPFASRGGMFSRDNSIMVEQENVALQTKKGSALGSTGAVATKESTFVIMSEDSEERDELVEPVKEFPVNNGVGTTSRKSVTFAPKPSFEAVTLHSVQHQASRKPQPLPSQGPSSSR